MTPLGSREGDDNDAWKIQSDVDVPVMRCCCCRIEDEVEILTFSDVKLASNSDPSSDSAGSP